MKNRFPDTRINALPPTRTSETRAPLPRETLQAYLNAATSESTRRAYRSAIRQFEKWGGRLPTDSETLMQYLLDRAETLNPRTLELHLTAIGQWHRYQGVENPVSEPLIQKTMNGIRRVHAKPKQKAKALRLEHVAAMANHVRARTESKKKHRDLALLLVGFFGAFRRSELAAIRVEDLIWEDEGLIVRLPRSKTDQTGQGILRALPFGNSAVCPGTALRSWLDAADIQNGPVFRAVNRWDQIQHKPLNPGAINQLLKQLGTECGFDFVDSLSSHSFRRGLSTSAAREKVDFELIKKQGGWKSDATVWEYIEEGQRLTDNATTVLMEKMATLAEMHEKMD
ncbi:site-specific integrase [Microbulbifer bruguierae]|uniref:Site-specific integrase n=1 Tax=Microbulbifer bruguierae TaxID=3029061 RepID=A0ABY8NDU4_9GAMM|nr:site-specific integrase [Microbulbifer bruguierae]WGL17096.1 site-specific integrase [Microbulbifer bruguierae]